MTLSLNTLQLCRQLLAQQTISANAGRADIEAVLDARDELDAAIAQAEKQESGGA